MISNTSVPGIGRHPAYKHLLRLQRLTLASALIVFVGLILIFARAPLSLSFSHATSDQSRDRLTTAEAASLPLATEGFNDKSTGAFSSEDENPSDTSKPQSSSGGSYYSSIWPDNVDCAHTANGTFTDTGCLMKEGREAALLYHNSRPHLDVFSSMSKDGNYFLVDFGDWQTFNVNILPDPKEENVYICIANLIGIPNYRYQIACQAQFIDNVMRCTHSPLTLPVAATFSDKCEGPNFGYNWNAGPTDARAFYGGDTSPYLTYGTPGGHACLSQYMHDLRRLYKWGENRFVAPDAPWFYATELQRPPPYHQVEKNYFVFWDRNMSTYVHTNLQPRVFARLYGNGSVSENLAPAATSDEKCMVALMPKLLPTDLEHNHQATNSLSVTLCKRSDPSCKPTDDNTFLMVIFQTKTFYSNIPGFYSPFVMMFNQNPPFQVHGVSKHPIWYSGRGRPHERWMPNDNLRQPQSEMFYTTSFSWKHQNLTYHGYLDDTILIGMGIMDKRSAVIDVVAGDLLSNMAFCGDVE